MKPVVSVGSNPPNSSIDDCFASYNPYIKTVGGTANENDLAIHLVRRTALNDHVALVQFQPDNSVHSALASRDSARDELALWGEKVTVVQDATQLDRDKLIAKRTDVSVECQPF